MSDILVQIRSNAELVIAKMQELGNSEFGYNPESIEILEGFIERQRLREDLTDNGREGLVNTLGSYLGQCILHCYGGEWTERDGTWGILLPGGTTAFPFAKVRKQFENGIDGGDGIKAFVNVIPAIESGLLNKPSAHKKPWWKLW